MGEAAPALPESWSVSGGSPASRNAGLSAVRGVAVGAATITSRPCGRIDCCSSHELIGPSGMATAPASRAWAAASCCGRCSPRTLHLELSVDQPVAMVAVRLSDVAPDGRAIRISYGLLNLTHRTGHHQPLVLVPGERYRVAVTLNASDERWPAFSR